MPVLSVAYRDMERELQLLSRAPFLCSAVFFGKGSFSDVIVRRISLRIKVSLVVVILPPKAGHFAKNNIKNIRSNYVRKEI